MKQPYLKSIQEIEKQLQTNSYSGLSIEQVKERLEQYGYNTLPKVKREHWIFIFFRQFKSPLIYILIIAAVIIFFVGEEPIDAFIITGVLMFNAIIGTIQERRTQNIIESLKRLIKTKSIAIRSGKHEVVDDSQIVPGDIIILQEGERVPADARIIQAHNLKVDEAILTGESQVVSKKVEKLDKKVPLGDQKNMVFKGTFVRAGSGKAIVVATGLETEIGKVHKSIEDITSEIPLQKQLRKLSYWILIIVLISCLFLLVVGLLTGRSLQELLVMLTALFICVIPEGLPVVLTVTLVRGAYLMAQQNVLAKNLQGVEGLGRTEVIIIDKTGTLTRNELIVSQVWTDGKTYTVTGQGYFTKGEIFHNNKPVSISDNSELECLCVASSLLNTSELSYNSKLKLFDIKGDPTEAALYILAQKMGLQKDQLEKSYNKIYEIPFDPKLKIHAAFYEHDDEVVAFVTGAPEAIMARSSQSTQEVEQELGSMLVQGLRVIAVGEKRLTKAQLPSNENDREKYITLLNDGVTILGLCGIEDSIRPEVRSVIEQARKAGLRVIMATGDHKQTAQFVAEKVGIFKPGDELLDGQMLEKLSDDELLKKIHKVTVYARVNPEDKVRIVNLFHKHGKIVAMTGDGVNDVPSLVGADIGIAMGSIGTEVAKNASDLVLLDDSFINITGAIQLGRHIFYTLRRVVLYFFSTNMAELLIVFFALFTNLPLPLTAAQILWLNFVTDGFLDVGISMEPQEKGLLRAEWLRKQVQLVDWNLIVKMFFLAIPMALGSMAIFWWKYTTTNNLQYARTMALITLMMYQWFNSWNCRSEGKSIIEIGIFTNRWFLLAAGFVLGLQFILLNVPFMQKIFKTVPLSLNDWLIIVVVTVPIVLIDEIRKLITYKLSRSHSHLN